MRVMKKFALLVLLAPILTALPFFGTRASATTVVSNGVVISELSAGDTKSASNEFVELYNDTAQVVDLSGMKLEYKSATGKTWYVKVTIPAGAQLSAHHYFTLRSIDGDDAMMQSGLAQLAGNVRLRNSAGDIIDQLAWGQADSALGSPAPVAKADQTIARRASGGGYQNSLDNATDFAIGAPTLGADNVLLTNLDSTGQGADDLSANFSRDITVTELLPDPVKPQVDNHDEFIELYNDGDSDQALNGYSLVDASGHSYKLDGQVIRAHSYLVLYSAQTKISLNNGGDTISLLAPNGEELITTPDYGKAKPGKSWGVTTDGWAWTQAPTPGALNATQLADDDSSASASKKTSAKSTSVKSKTANAKSSKVAKKASAKSGANGGGGVDENKNATGSNWSWLLIVLGIGTIGYGIYEYRSEITDFVQKLRAKFGVGKKARPKS